MQRVLPGLRRILYNEARAPARTHDDGRLPHTSSHIRIAIFVDVVRGVQRFSIHFTIRK
jgi:hypothetical protein